MSAREPGAPSLAAAFPDAGELLDVLRAARMTLATAESCTGGLFSAALTAFPGASDVLLGGVVSYADSVKVSLLDVGEEVLRAHGAVSAEVARAMAAGARQRCSADMGVGITGVAGPGAEGSKAAGLIFVAVDAEGVDEVLRLEGDGGREQNRAGAVRAAIALCRRAVEVGA